MNNILGYAQQGGLLFAAALALACNGPAVNDNETTRGTTATGGSAIPQVRQQLGDTVTADGLNVSLYAEGPLYSRYEPLYVHVQDSAGNPATEVTVDFSTFMDMGMMSHGGPFSAPQPVGEGWHRGAAVFIMPDVDDMGKGWLLHIQVVRGGKTDSLTFKLPVSQAPTTRTLAFDGGNDGRFFISLLLPDTVAPGKLPIRFALHGIDRHDFPAADGYSLQLTPFMPDMGHSSPDNQDAQSMGDGYYEGLVNLTMAGLWEIHGTLLKDGKQVSTDPIVFKIQAE